MKYCDVFVCVFCRCVCTMPKEPSNATLNYWEEKNITASEIDWLGLDVKVSVTVGAFKSSW